MRSAQWIRAALNLVGQNILGFVAFAIGAAIGRVI
jgi:hypothetical protein